MSFTEQDLAYLRSQPLALYARITPHVSSSWNMAGEPVGDTWYEARRAAHIPDERGRRLPAPREEPPTEPSLCHVTFRIPTDAAERVGIARAGGG